MAVEAREVSCYRFCLTSASRVVRYSVEALFVRLLHFCCFFETKFQKDEPSTESLFLVIFYHSKKDSEYFLNREASIIHLFDSFESMKNAERFSRECHECPTHDTD